jgi:organic radical activating enzyme
LKKNQRKLQNNTSFCLAPWIHSYISPQGLRQICCVSDQNFGTNKSLNEIWNCDDMKIIRQKMLAGEELDVCVRCNGGSLNPNPYRNYFNEKYSHLIDDVISKTSEDGTYNEYPVTFDYRTNVCNFKCKTCSEEFSTQIQLEKIQNNSELLYNILSSEERELSLKIIDDEFKNDDLLKNVSEIYWAGGEPMYWKTHWETLDKLIELGVSKNVKLRYHSNLSTIEHKGKLLTEYFDNFKRIEFFCSLDGTGPIGEWVRTNLNYEKWKDNFSKLVAYRDMNNHLEVQLAITVTTPTIFDFENLYELCKEFNISPDFQTCYSLEATNLLSPKSFPKNLIEPILTKFLDSHINDNNYIIDKFRIYCGFLLSQDFFENDATYNDNFKEGVKRILYLDENRPYRNITFDTILLNNKELSEYYQKKKFENIL